MRRRLLATMLLLGVLATFAAPAAAHCDGEDGPVATAALRALEAGNE